MFHKRVYRVCLDVPSHDILPYYVHVDFGMCVGGQFSFCPWRAAAIIVEHLTRRPSRFPVGSSRGALLADPPKRRCNVAPLGRCLVKRDDGTSRRRRLVRRHRGTVLRLEVGRRGEDRGAWQCSSIAKRPTDEIPSALRHSRSHFRLFGYAVLHFTCACLLVEVPRLKASCALVPRLDAF